MYKGKAIPDLRGSVMLKGWSTKMAGRTRVGGRFSVAYGNLHRYVRRPGIESPMPMMTPMEFHADTTELIQLLVKGHHNVKLDTEAWERLATWIDFNAPYHGRWSTIVGEKAAAPKEKQRSELRNLYAKVDEDHEALPEPSVQKIKPIIPVATTPSASAQRTELRVIGKRDQTVKALDLGDDVTIEFVHIPAGEFAMGSAAGYPDEVPVTQVRIAKSFWMGKFEVTNEQFRRFDSTHDSREEDRHGYQFGIPGYTVNGPKLPAVRLSWKQAIAYCAWLSKKTGKTVTLPTEAQWEWACRAGADTPFSYGDLDTDFSTFANMGDITLSDFSGNPYKLDPKQARYGNPENIYDNWIPQDGRFNDGGFVSEAVGKYKPNAWGLQDMHGNAAEWTRSLYKPYPYEEASDRNALDAKGKRVIRGGSWYDRPKRCTSSYRYGYRDYQKVFNVGFRVVMEP